MSALIESYRRAVGKLLVLASNVPDPRKRCGVRHKLDIVLTIFVLALLCDQNDFLRVEDWAKSEFETLKQIMPLPHGIPSHDTFMRVIGLLPVESIENLFVAWICECYPSFSNHLAVDGKTVSGTLRTADWKTDFKEAQKNRVHVVSVFDCNAFQVVRQQIMPDKGGELLSASEMLYGLELHGKMVTSDAEFCNSSFASQVVKQGGDFCLQVKGNQPSLQKSVIAQFAHALPDEVQTYVDDRGGHGRIERREYRILSDELPFYLHDSWAHIGCLIAVHSNVKQKSTGKETASTRYYVSSKPMTALEVSEIVRGH